MLGPGTISWKSTFLKLYESILDGSIHHKNIAFFSKEKLTEILLRISWMKSVSGRDHILNSGVIIHILSIVLCQLQISWLSRLLWYFCHSWLNTFWELFSLIKLQRFQKNFNWTLQLKNFGLKSSYSRPTVCESRFGDESHWFQKMEGGKDSVLVRKVLIAGITNWN